MTKFEFTKAQCFAMGAARDILDRAPWRMFISTNRVGAPVITIYDRSRALHEEMGTISYTTLKYSREALQEILSRVHDELGRSLGIQTLIDDRLAFRGSLPLDVEAGTKLALFAILARGIKEPYRIELLAWRIKRFTYEEATYWLGKVSIPVYGDESIAWAVTGLRTMLAGRPGDKEAIEAALDKARGW